MTWIDTLARRWGRAPRAAHPSRARRFQPGLEQLQRRDVPAVLLPASLSGYVYCDCDCDGNFDPGETPISGVTITLTGTDVNGFPVSQTTTTDTTGLYSFANLTPGTYTIRETQPADVGDGIDRQGTPGNGVTGNDVFTDIVLESGVDGKNNNFGEKCEDMPPPPPPPKKGELCGVVYVDCNKNGKFDSGDDGIRGVKVTLTGPNGFSRVATTDSSGRYSFKDLPAGTYVVTEAQPAGYAQGTNTPGIPTNGMVNGDMISGVVVNGNKVSGYNFGEKLLCGCDPKDSHGKGSDGKGSCGKGSDGKGSHGRCDNRSHGKGSCGKGSGGKGSHGKGSRGKGSDGKGSRGRCDNGSRGKGSHGKGSHDRCDNGSRGKGSHGKGSDGKGSRGKGSHGKGRSRHC